MRNMPESTTTVSEGNFTRFVTMIKVGEHNEMEVLRNTSVGMYLGDGEGGEVLLPNKYVPEDLEEGDEIEVFIYKDSEDRLVATTLAPKIFLNDFACLKVKQVNSTGAFLEWGMEKDLLVPYSEQKSRLHEGTWCMAYMYLDETTERLVATNNWTKYCSNEEIGLEQDERVRVIIAEETDLGHKVLINKKYEGLIYKNEIFEDLRMGDRRSAFVKEIRPDNKIDISLQQHGGKNITAGSQAILDYMEENNGFLALTDKSSPEKIKELLKMSKKTFKKAIGSLYKQRLVKLEDKGIRLIK
jgi:predicted RNA-binding protein (virulence factor B family)